MQQSKNGRQNLLINTNFSYFQQVNCLTETCFDAAKERAQYLDNLRRAGKLAGPLHGLPISLKDSFHVAGTFATIGMVAYLDRKSETTSALVDILLDLGAVVYCKTNIPQTLMVRRLTLGKGQVYIW
jgi:amidase